MSNTVSLDFQISIQRRGKGAKKQFVEGKPKTAVTEASTGRVPRISRFMALAIHFEELIRSGVVSDYAELARLGHVTTNENDHRLSTSLILVEATSHAVQTLLPSGRARWRANNVVNACSCQLWPPPGRARWKAVCGAPRTLNPEPPSTLNQNHF